MADQENPDLAALREKYQTAQREAAMTGTCPHRGYCPHCGRSSRPYFAPTYPPWSTPYQPWWWQQPYSGFTTTTGGAIGTRTIIEGGPNTGVWGIKGS